MQDWIRILGTVVFKHKEKDILISISDVESIRSQMFEMQTEISELKKLLLKEKQMRFKAEAIVATSERVKNISDYKFDEKV